MITCPWCNTSYTLFQSSCQKCGGPIPPPVTTPLNAGARISPPPPPAPRPFADNYAWKLALSDAWTVASLVFLLLGGIFTLTGIPLTLGIITSFVGFPFLGLGLIFLAAGGVIFNKGFKKARTTVKVLREGQSVLGQINSVEMNFAVRVNGRHPWTIKYAFQAAGNNYEGQVTTLEKPNLSIQGGKSAYVLYLPDAPENNALYPHP
ncbi:MAG: hypothetical protein HZB19_22145 [Chloroflexi bacterium]|nr:hypothetical protein [Chloroflexota bacterium]